MRILIAIFLLLVSPVVAYGATCAATLAQGETETCDEITKNGITWSFAQDYTVGQFVDGSYWVVDSGSGVSVDGITPFSNSSSTPVENGCAINPSPSDNTGFDSDIPYIDYSSAVNVCADVNVSNLLVLSDGDSLVSVDSASSTCGIDSGSRIQAMAILTCVSSPPAAGSFRPPYVGVNKPIHNISEIDYTSLANVSASVGAPNILTVAEYFANPWFDINGPWQYRSLHPCDNMPDYGAVISRYISLGVLTLNTAYTNEEKYPLLVGMLQYAIDLSEGIANGATYPADGGHGLGRKSALTLGAIVLGDSTMVNQLDESHRTFAEDMHVWEIVPSDWGRVVTGYDGNGVTYNSTDHPQGTPEWGRNHTVNPSMDDSRTQTYYRNYYMSQLGGLLGVQLMGGQSDWDSNIPFDYIERAYGFLPCTLDCAYNATTWEQTMYSSYWGVAITWYEDADGDGYHAGNTQSSATDPGSNWYEIKDLDGGSDCNDNNASINPGETDICGNGIAEDCVADVACPTSGVSAYTATEGGAFLLFGGGCLVAP